MSWLDEAIEGSVPPSLGAEPEAREEAIAIARASLRQDIDNRRSLPLAARIGVGMAVGLGVIGLGVGTAVAVPAVIDWLGWTPDVVAQRSFDFTDGVNLGLCQVSIRVSPQGGEIADDDAKRATEAARVFLREHDWRAAIDSISAVEIQAEFERDQARREASSGEPAPPPATLSGAATTLMADRITEEFERAGYLQPGVAIEAAAEPCDAATEDPTQ